MDFRITSSVDGVGKLEKIPAALEIITSQDWKIYWKNPGGPGYPPKIKLEEQFNIAKFTFYWPSPKRFSFLGVDNFGYEGEIIFPLEFFPSQRGEEISAIVRASILACKHICIPVERLLNFKIPNKEAIINSHARKRPQIYTFLPKKENPPNDEKPEIK